jgi:hypothetical protein
MVEQVLEIRKSARAKNKQAIYETVDELYRKQKKSFLVELYGEVSF